LRQNTSIVEQGCAGFSPGSANRCDQFTRHPGRTSLLLWPCLSFRYRQKAVKLGGTFRPLRRVANAASFVSLIVALLALVGTMVTGYLQSQSAKEAAALNFKAAERSSDIHMSEIAVSILRAPITDDVASIRGWAMDVIDSTNSRKFTDEERQSLLKKPIPTSNSILVFPNTIDGWKSATWMNYVPDLCSKFVRANDGSWNQIAVAFVPGGSRGFTANNNRYLQGTEEADVLEKRCRSRP
jgi:hypothetical protein